MLDVIIRASLMAAGFCILAFGWLWIEGVAAIRKYQATKYRGKHVKSRKIQAP